MTTLTLVSPPAAADRSSYERTFAALDAAGCEPRARGDAGLDACCPAHDDASPSLSADWRPPTADKAGRVLIKCHAGCDLDAILAGLDLTRADLFDGYSPQYAAKAAAGAAPSPRRRSGLPRQSAPAAPRKVGARKTKPKADHEHVFADERTHTYADTDGVIVAQIHRKRCTVPGCREKTFGTGYPNGKPADGIPLYGTPELADAIAAGRTIHVCEGEGDCEALAAVGEVAVSAPFGADNGKGKKWLPRHTEQLRGARSVLVHADRDPAGLRHAGYIANQLLATGAVPSEGLRIVYGAVDAPAADVSDHLAAGYGPADWIDVPAEDLASTDLEGPATTPAAPAPEPGTRKPLQEAQEAATRPLEDADGLADRDDNGEPGMTPPGSAVEGSSGWRYSTTTGRQGALWKASGRGENRTFEQELTWCPVTEERLVKLNDDGTVGGKYFTVRVGEDTHTISVADMRTGEAWDRYPDAVGTGSKPVREVLLNCVETQARSMARTPVVTHTGWYDLPDVGLTYIYADGRTYPEGRSIKLIGAPEQLAQAAAPLGRTADDAECRQAVLSIAQHGWAGLMNLAVGARSLGYSLRPVPATFLIDAEPNSGKTSAANNGRGLLYTNRPKPWPPVVTKGFNATVTDIECAVDFEGDSPLLIDDLALTRASTAMEVRDAQQKLELLLRAAGNQTDIRGRRNRDLTAKAGNRVRAIPVIAAQMLPPSMQESLYRRSVVIYLSREGGEHDWRWYRDEGGAALSVPLRTIGEKIIAHIHSQQDPDAYLADLEDKALKQLAPYAEAALPEASGTMDGVVTAAAGMLSGLGLLAAVTGLEMEQLIAVVAEPLAASLARQAAKMDDQHVMQDDLGTAVVEVVRHALATGRAHVRDDKGTISPAIPGEVEQVQGVTKDGAGGWEGKGPAFYWLPNHEPGPAFGVRTAELHTLLKASSDARVQGIGQRTLPAALLQAGLTIPTQQKGRHGVHRVRVGTDLPRLLLLKGHLVWDLEPPSDDGPGDGGGGTGGQPSASDPARGGGTNPSENSFAYLAEKNGNNGNNGNTPGQSPVATLFEAVAAQNGNTAGHSAFPASEQPADADGHNALTSNVPVVPVPSGVNGNSNGNTASGDPAAAQNGNTPLTSGIPVPAGPEHDTATSAPADGNSALTCDVPVLATAGDDTGNGNRPPGAYGDIPMTTDDLAQEDDDVAHFEQQQLPCVVCGKPTSRRDDDGRPQHINIPGVFSCITGFLNGAEPGPAAPETAAAPANSGTTPATADPSPASAASPPAAQPAAVSASAPPQPDAYPNGPLAVIDVADGETVAHLVDGRTLAVAAKTLPALITWAVGAGLGQTRLHKWGTDSDPLIVLTPAASTRYGLPERLEDRRHLRLPEDHKAIKALTKAGWTLTKRGFSSWTRVYKPIGDSGRRECVQLAIVAWDALGPASGWHLDPDTDPATIARTLGAYAQHVIAPRGSMATNGLELMLQLRPATRPVKDEDTGTWVSGPVPGSLTRACKPAPCEAPPEHPLAQGRDEEADAMHEEAWNWHRDPTSDETVFPNVIGIDTNTSFLAGSSRLLVGDGDPAHVTAPTFNPKVPGAWRVDLSAAHEQLAHRLTDGQFNPLDPRLPNPFTPDGAAPTGPGWYTTQTLDYARKLGIEVKPIEAWLREPLGAGWLDPWNERLAAAYKTTMARLGITPDMPPEAFLEAMERYAAGDGDPVERALLKAIKQTVKSGIGKLRTSPARYIGYRPGQPWPELDKPWWRPDIRASVIATARIIQHRKIVKTFELTGRAPLATYSDCVVYPANGTSPLELIPRKPDGEQVAGAFRLGVQPGWAKHEGTRPMDWYTEQHASGINPARYVAPRASERVDEGE